MSNMFRLLVKLPTVPMLGNNVQAQVTPDEIETLSWISDMVETEEGCLLSGIDEISEIIDEIKLNDDASSRERILHLSCLKDAATTTVAGLRYLESAANAILEHHRRAGGES